jgi:hypothetical protein
MLQYHTISGELKNLLNKLMQIDELTDFILVGGTALSLRYGHRISIDIDLFTHQSFDVDKLDKRLESLFPESLLLTKERHGLSREIDQIKIDCYYFGSPFIRRPDIIDGIRVCSVEDIVAFKFESLVRLERKDFYDIAIILDHFSLSQMVEFYKEKYPTHNIRMVFDNLLRFKEAENTPPPNLIIPGLTWEDVTNKITNAFSGYKSDLLIEKKKKENARIHNANELIRKKRNLP